MTLEIVGQVVVPSVIASGTMLAWLYARGRKEGSFEERLKAIEAHSEDENFHCAPQHHERLARIEERVDGIKDGLDTLAERVERALVRRPVRRAKRRAKRR